MKTYSCLLRHLLNQTPILIFLMAALLPANAGKNHDHGENFGAATPLLFGVCMLQMLLPEATAQAPYGPSPIADWQGDRQHSASAYWSHRWCKKEYVGGKEGFQGWIYLTHQNFLDDMEMIDRFAALYRSERLDIECETVQRATILSFCLSLFREICTPKDKAPLLHGLVKSRIRHLCYTIRRFAPRELGLASEILEERAFNRTKYNYLYSLRKPPFESHPFKRASQKNTTTFHHFQKQPPSKGRGKRR